MEQVRRAAFVTTGWGFVLAALGLGLTLAGCGSDEGSTAGLAPLAVAEKDAAGNRPPVVRQLRIEPNQPVQGDRVRAVATAHDPEGDALELRYVWRVDGLPAESRGDQLSVAGVEKGSRIEVVVTASDGRSESEASEASVTVIDRAPVMHGIAIQPTKTVYPGDRVVVTPTGSDPDEDPVEFAFEWLVNGEAIDNEGRSLSTAGLSAGDRIRVRVVASDGNSESRPQESMDVTVGSAHPEFVSSPPGMTDEGVFRYAVEARDPDGDRNLRYRLAEAPDGMTMDDVMGEIEWRPNPSQTGTHQVRIVVRDSSRLETTQSFEVTVSAPSDGAATPAAVAK